ncbi:hypothetical protein OpiT1DRAFT_02447 [Opitutaceae bacterium TAV1]|nr:hypothetical protein OpiT1DRAFT_02447 [Opitutaceae bacterium TAV1]
MITKTSQPLTRYPTRTTRTRGFILSALAAATIGLIGAPLPSHAQTILWKLDDTATPLTATDSSGNGNDGTVYGNVTGGGASGVSGTAFSGFTSAASNIRNTLGTGAGRANLTLSLWFTNPGSSGHNTLVGLGKDSLTNSDRAWEIFLSDADPAGARTLTFLYGQNSGFSRAYQSTTFTIESDAWYYLALVYQGSTTSTTGSDFTIYLAKQGDDSLGTPLLSGTTVALYTATANNTLYVGGVTEAYHGGGDRYEHFVAGYFGGGIDQVSVWKDTLLDASQLDADFARGSVPEPATVALFFGIVAILLVHRWRQRYSSFVS